MLEDKYLETFLSRLVKGADCWEWDGAHTTAGYSLGWNGKSPVYAHREAYEHFVGPIPDGLVIDHLCDNRGCVNPEHLRAVSQQENILRGTGMSARHALKTHCNRGHEYSPDNTYVDPRGRRTCRKCQRLWGRNRWKRQAANPAECACGCGETVVKGTYHRGHHPNSRANQF